MTTTDNLTILKFGGTSVGDADAMRQVASVVRAALPGPVVVIASACAGVTDSLTDLCGHCRELDRTAADKIISGIGLRHREILHELTSDDPDSDALSGLEALLDELAETVRGIFLLEETSDRSVDTVLSFGERLSTYVLSTLFRGEDLDIQLGDSRAVIKTDNRHGRAVPDFEEIKSAAQREIRPLLQDGTSVLLQGFIGSAPDGTTTTIGRGGSDHTAALLGAALGAAEIQIWTDVDGIMTADPRVVKQARVVPEMSFTEARELASFGAKVLHPDTILPAISRDIPVVIRNTWKSENPGTRIVSDARKIPAGFHALSLQRNLTQLELRPRDNGSNRGDLDRALGLFGQHGAPIECAVVAESRASLVIDPEQLSQSLQTALETTCRVDTISDTALLCLIGSGLRSTPALLVRALAPLNAISISMVCGGSSNHLVLLALRETDAEAALTKVHATLFESQE